MPLPTTISILAAPADTLPAILHRTRNGGMRAHTSAARLATMVASGMVSVARTEVAMPANLRLPPRVGAESDDHRLLRALGRELVLSCDPSALVGMEVSMTYGDLRRRLDGLAITTYGPLVMFAGACDGRDVAELLADRPIMHALVLPHRGLEPAGAVGYLFSRATATRLPLPLA